MARQVGHIKYIGKLGGVSHYKQKGVKGYLARMAWGPSAKRIKNDPAFARLRECNNEFKGCTLMVKAVRKAFLSSFRSKGEIHYTGLLTAVMTRIAQRDPIGKRGARGILLSLAPEELAGMEFKGDVPLSEVFKAKYWLHTNLDLNETYLDIVPFMPVKALDIPPGASHFQIVLAIASISDIVFDPKYGYKPLHPHFHGLKHLVSSPYIPVDARITEFDNLTATLPGRPLLAPGVSLVTAVGIAFFQKYKEEWCQMEDHSAMRFEGVFGL